MVNGIVDGLHTRHSQSGCHGGHLKEKVTVAFQVLRVSSDCYNVFALAGLGGRFGCMSSTHVKYTKAIVDSRFGCRQDLQCDLYVYLMLMVPDFPFQAAVE